jgi:oligopeptide/dipeptide ABC transporter ATP-binding protein
MTATLPKSRTVIDQRSHDVVLQVEDLRVDYGWGAAAVHAVTGVDLGLQRGEVLGIAGESGSGKSTLAYAMTRLLRSPGHTTAGRVSYWPKGGAAADPVDVLGLGPKELRSLRWAELAVVFQAAMSSLNPVLSVLSQLSDGLAAHRPAMTRRERRARCVELLELVGIDVQRLSAYPHQLSGGQRQRVMIAMALALEPEVVVMDEPTTSLDVVVQREILDQIMALRERMGCSIIFITHDLSLLDELADRIAVMYAGRIIEQGAAWDITRHPEHPYTAGLLGCFPRLRGPRVHLTGIPGTPPDPRCFPTGCTFHPRCAEADDRCADQVPALLEVAPGQQAACLHRRPLRDDTHARRAER